MIHGNCSGSIIRKSRGQMVSILLSKGFFRSVPDGRKPYTIVIPPPNVTGVLHMVIWLNNTIQDLLIRRARMSGKNALWVRVSTMLPLPQKPGLLQNSGVKASKRKTSAAKNSLNMRGNGSESTGESSLSS